MGVAIVGMTKNETSDENGDGILTVSESVLKVSKL